MAELSLISSRLRTRLNFKDLYKNYNINLNVSLIAQSVGNESNLYNLKTKVFLLAGQSNMDGRGDAKKFTKQDLQALG